MTITEFTPLQGLIGGLMIGLASALWLWLYGRVAGISGLLGHLAFKSVPAERSWRAMFLVGLIAGAVIYAFAAPAIGLHPIFSVDLQRSWPIMILAGLLVGFGTRLGNGCTSGHGVCGLARLSPRSLVATCTFMACGFVTAIVINHLLVSA
ncbi:MAG TPA: YeeE/YedE family protein [Nevskiaceae bacterium]|nr:YeeE/YedE family protein [Nevskiaceae bacterium]